MIRGYQRHEIISRIEAEALRIDARRTF